MANPSKVTAAITTNRRKDTAHLRNCISKVEFHWMEHHNNKRESQKADSRKTALPPQTQIGATQENA